MQGQSSRRRSTALAALTTLAVATAAAPAGAMSLPAPPQLTLTPASGSAIELWRHPGCNDVVMPPTVQPVATAAACVSPLQLAPTATLATPSSFELRSDQPLASLDVAWEAGSAAAPSQPPVATQRDGTGWTLALPALTGTTGLRVSAGYAAGLVATYYLNVARPAGGQEPEVDPPAAELAIVDANRRGRTATVVVEATRGTVSAYLTVGFGRRTAVVRATVRRAGQVRLRIPLGRLSTRALASAGVTAVLRPADSGRQVRAGVRWKAAVAR
jgi:hypothetical protein